MVDVPSFVYRLPAAETLHIHYDLVGNVTQREKTGRQQQQNEARIFLTVVNQWTILQFVQCLITSDKKSYRPTVTNMFGLYVQK